MEILYKNFLGERFTVPLIYLMMSDKKVVTYKHEKEDHLLKNFPCLDNRGHYTPSSINSISQRLMITRLITYLAEISLIVEVSWSTSSTILF